MVESLELLQRKSGEEVSDPIYHFEDKSGRHLALRPNDPRIATLVATRQGQLAFQIVIHHRPVLRYERMTRDRKREHYQWNMDVIADILDPEIEILAAAAAGLKGMCRTAAYKIHVNNRALLAELLAEVSIAKHHAASGAWQPTSAAWESG